MSRQNNRRHRLPTLPKATSPIINNTPRVPQDKYADCWQSKLNTVAERNRYILDHSLFTDCSFLVGRDPQKLFKCHKLFLAQCSAALEALLYGPEKVTSFPIALPDVHPDAFQHMLDYMYCDELKLLDREQVEALMYVCKKYNVRYLVAKCQKFLCASSTRNTVRAM